MKQLLELSNEEARKHFLKASSYFICDLPPYLSFEPILTDVDAALKGATYAEVQAANPSDFSNVNYSIVANKDGRFAWRPYELIHPVIYVSLVNVICRPENWKHIADRLYEFKKGAVDCCSAPVMSLDHQTDVAAQVRGWWQNIEQRSLAYSLEFSHVLHTDVVDCYGSVYTHSIPWALHGLIRSKKEKRDKSLVGNKIDSHIQASRHGQTNGICQGSVLMDFIAEIVLGYVDELISAELPKKRDFRIFRYRDDYRVFANNDDRAEQVLKVISDKLRGVGLKLGVSKTFMCRNVVEGSVKPDKLAGIELQDLGDANAKTIQKQLLRLHAFGQRFPNSGALRRLVTELHIKITAQTQTPDDLDVQVAIATDIGFVSPATFPVIAGILSSLISLAPPEEKRMLWSKVRKKMARVPYNGYLEIWLQRVTQPKAVGIPFDSAEAICRIVNGEGVNLWENGWIASKDVKAALDTLKIVVGSVADAAEIVQPKEVELFKQNAWVY